MLANQSLVALVYVIPLVTIVALYLRSKANTQSRNITARDEAIAAGLIEPASLHPVINENKCIGCGSCVNACPQHPGHMVLGVINGKSRLIGPTDCIGHGACKDACPMEAISLVFGTEKRGIDIPLVSPSFETNVPGIFIAGELGGMGLIKNAIEQGRKAIESIAKLDGIKKGPGLDVVIVGAGPAGFAASLGAMELGLRFATVEQDSLGGTVAHYPRGKIVMTCPAKLPLIGMVKFWETTKEELLEFWHNVEKKTNLKINYKERVEAVNETADGLEVKTNRDTYQTKAILLAIGRRGTPRKLGVPGEELPKVVYRLFDPEQYRGQHVLVVGGGDSALEAAWSIAAEPETSVSISYRQNSFSRAKAKNRQKIEDAEKENRVRVILSSNVKCITPTHVQLDQAGKMIELKNDAVIVNAGGILPTPFLKQIGITVETKHGKP